jgi:RNA polymerase sigma-70 factor (ECF subfamily)
MRGQANGGSPLSEPGAARRRLAAGTSMNEWAGDYPDAVVTEDAGLAAEFDARVRETSALAFRVAYGVLRQRQDAEEVAQEAFLRAHARYGRLRDRERFQAWLVRVVWRLAIDRWRADRRRLARESRATREDVRTPDDLAASARQAAAIRAAIDALPPKLRMTIVLAAIEGHGVREVASLLRLPEGTVKSRLFLARRQLAEQLQWLADDTRQT